MKEIRRWGWRGERFRISAVRHRRYSRLFRR
jgi:hypothetical protein